MCIMAAGWLKGQLIAKTDGGDATLEVEKATKQLEKAKVDLADRLIGLGDDGISANVPADVMHRAKVASGYYLPIPVAVGSQQYGQMCACGSFCRKNRRFGK